ncbi:hypothetical protein AB0H77_21855 [Streptomyces sp. NPDC050844]|uniref:hypothetical protein n=1 Tax=Streptomyces sp. NPDC050844 TaxID=3155790 RepID=UPI003406B79E
MSERSVPCGCHVSLNSQGEPVGFSRECAEARQLFTRLMRAPNSQGQQPISAELKRHITAQL